MTITNPFTLAALTTASEPALAASEHAETPYEALCADTQRPVAFTMTFVEPAAA